MSGEALTAGHVAPFRMRIRRFFFRVCWTLLVMGGIAFLAVHQVDTVQHDGILDHPLVVALDEVNASLRTTELTATALVNMDYVPTMEQLKSFASRIALRDETDLWTDVNSHYYAVYFKGNDVAGGAWTASARYVAGQWDQKGHVEISLKRDVHGGIDSLRQALYQMKVRLQRAGGLAVNHVMTDVRIQARLMNHDDPQHIMTTFMRSLGADTFWLDPTGDGWHATGYTPRIADAVERGGRRQNVAVKVSQLGQAGWIEIGSPVL